MKHSETDQVSLEIARRVAERLRSRPELLEMARSNLARWVATECRRSVAAPVLCGMGGHSGASAGEDLQVAVRGNGGGAAVATNFALRWRALTIGGLGNQIAPLCSDHSLSTLSARQRA